MRQCAAQIVSFRSTTAKEETEKAENAKTDGKVAVEVCMQACKTLAFRLVALYLLGRVLQISKPIRLT